MVFNQYRNPMTPLGSALRRAAAPDQREPDTARFALAVVAAGKLRRAEQLTDAERAALDAYAGDEERSPIDAQRKAFAEQVILAGKMRRNEV